MKLKFGYIFICVLALIGSVYLLSLTSLINLTQVALIIATILLVIFIFEIGSFFYVKRLTRFYREKYDVYGIGFDSNGFHTQSVIPHPFLNFTTKKPDISINDYSGETIYFTGDCALSENHHKDEVKYLYHLNKEVGKHSRDLRFMDSSCQHYTILHCLNNLVVDSYYMKVNKPKYIVCSAGINDAFVFLHHKDGVVQNDYTNYYMAYSNKPLQRLYTDIQKSNLLKALFFIYFSRYLNMWDFNVLKANILNCRKEKVDIAEAIFTTAYFDHYLEMFIMLCRGLGVDLILCTQFYYKPHMDGYHRVFISRAIDEINNSIINICKKKGVVCFDSFKYFNHFSDRHIYNKWHYTKMGNKERAFIFADFLKKL